ncbi:MAG: MotA/TolQ/ExbB proton channel family protein [Pseudomonadales bacterium]|nr:MotA/TolQ/ExbB proton channel family protein [Pseudomonadales bacterium]MCP5215198.1 MotA/TolQ/ExbB proton channel family protein [Pseudomonadales bacterium]
MIKFMRKGTLLSLVCGLTFGLTLSSSSYANDAVTLDELLNRVKQGTAQDNKEQNAREAKFAREKQEQANLLAQAKKIRAQEEARSAKLEADYAANEIKLENKKQQLTERLGVLKELFGTVQGVAGDLSSTLNSSLVSAQYPGRTEFLDALIKKMGSNTQLATIEELERVWYLLQQEMTETGRVARYTTTVVSPQGDRQEKEVIRVGAYNIVSDGNYLQYDKDTETLLVLARQPAGRYTSNAEKLQNATTGFTQFGVDPTGPSGGSYLAALIDSPDLIERIHQGREVGYIIIVIGIIALLISFWRLLALSAVGAKVNSQLKNISQPNTNNPLGRVLAVNQQNAGADTETLELKLHEAVLKETPALEKWIGFIKITSMVAPLLGLLGTVTGMILTFQALTIFGTGDPKAMAGGISSALVTTVLGLCVAIPTVFLHALVSGRSKKIIHIMEEQSAGIIAEQSEQNS